MYTEEALINAETLCEDIDKALSGGLEVFAALDPMLDKTLIPRLFTVLPKLEYDLLFRDTPMRHLLHMTPYYCRVTSVGEPRALLRECPELFGFIAIGLIPFKMSFAHWRSLLQVRSGSGTTHFRFYGSMVLYRLWSALSEGERANLLGPHALLYVPVRKTREAGQSWSQLRSGGYPEKSAALIAKNFSLRDAPWWVFTEEHWEAFKEQRPAILANNICEYLFTEYPERAGRRHGESDLEEFALTQLRRGMDMGLREPETLQAFTACCLLYGEAFPRGSSMEAKDFSGMTEETCRNKLQALCAKAGSV